MTEVELRLLGRDSKMSKGGFTDFENALRAFESGVDEARYRSGQISETQIRGWIGDQNWNLLQAGQLSWRDAQYLSMNSLGFVGYQLGEALLIDLGYYQDSSYYGNGAATNTWDGTWTGKGGVTSLAALKTGLQEGVMLDAFGYNLGIIENGLAAQGKTLDSLIGQTRSYTSGGQTVSVELSLTGILAAAHLRGAYGTLDLLLNNQVSSDENGTSILKYMSDFGGYDPIDRTTLRNARQAGTTEALSEQLWNIDFNRDGTIAGAATSPFTNGPDRVLGGDGPDTMRALGGNDTVSGRGGDDLIYGNTGDDVLSGNLGRDTLTGGQDRDLLFGGQDADMLYGNLGDDTLYGNLGDDFISGGQGSDTLYGGQGSDTLNGGLGNDLMFGNLGADRFVFGAGQGNDRVSGFSQAEGDRLSLGGQSYMVSEQAGSAVLSLSGGGSVTLLGISAGSVNSGFFV